MTDLKAPPLSLRKHKLNSRSLLLATAVSKWDMQSGSIWIRNKLHAWSVQPLRKYYESSRKCSLSNDTNTYQIKSKSPQKGNNSQFTSLYIQNSEKKLNVLSFGS